MNKTDKSLVWLTKKKGCMTWGAWVAQSVKCPTLDFSSGHDLRVHGFEPCIGLCADIAEPAWDSLSPSLSAPPLLSLSLCSSLSQKNKKTNFRGTWVARSVKRPALAQVMIWQFTLLSPASGSALTAQSLEPVSDSVSPSLSAPPPLVLCLSLSLSQI